MQHGKYKIVQMLHVFEPGFQLNGLDLMKKSLTTRVCAVPWQSMIDRLYAVTNLKEHALDIFCDGSSRMLYTNWPEVFEHYVQSWPWKCAGLISVYCSRYFLPSWTIQALFLEVLMNFMVPFIWIHVNFLWYTEVSENLSL